MQPAIVATDGLAVGRAGGFRAKTWLTGRAVALAVPLALGLSVFLQAGESGLAGRWRLEFQPAGGRAPWQVDCVLEQEGARVSGGCTSGFDAMASVRGTATKGRVTFTLEPKGKGAAASDEAIRQFNGRMNRQGTRITGTWTTLRSSPSSPSSPSRPSRPASGPFTAIRR